MIIRMLGASLGGTTRGGHQAVDCIALSLITPPNSGAGGGSCLPLMVEVDAGEPGVPVVSISVALALALAASSSAAASAVGRASRLPLAPPTVAIICNIPISSKWLDNPGSVARREIH